MSALLLNLVHALAPSPEESKNDAEQDYDPDRLDDDTRRQVGASGAVRFSEAGTSKEGQLREGRLQARLLDEAHADLSDNDDCVVDEEEAEPIESRSSNGNDDDDRATSIRRRSTWESSSTTLLADRSPKKSLFSRVKTFIYPPPVPLEEFIPTYRYAPIVSGLVIPFSILLEIPALTGHWYIRTVENAVVESQPNPFILDLGLGFSIAFALIANISLVLRFLEKKVRLMTISCIIFLSIHDIINVIAVTTFGVEHRFSDGFTYGQSFWMTVCSTVASCFTNVTLLWDLIRTPEFARSGSGLTHKQRSLVIIVILLLCYVALGSLVNAFLIPNLAFIDALYFTVASIETIGFGDIVPISTGARVFMCAYAAVGIVNLALAVGMARETVLEALEVGYRLRVEGLRERRREAHRWRRVEQRWREAVEWRLTAKGQQIWVKDDESEEQRLFSAFKSLWFRGSRLVGRDIELRTFSPSKAGKAGASPPHGMHLNLEALSRQQLEAAAMEAGMPLETLLPDGFRFKDESAFQQRWKKQQGDQELGLPSSENGAKDPTLPLTHARLGRMITMIGGFALAMNRDAVLKRGSRAVRSGGRKSLSQQLLDDDDQKALHDTEENKAFFARLIVAWLLFLAFWMSGAAIFSTTEGWSFGVGLYFCYISFTTLGYGDYSPKSPAGRSIFVVWALLGVGAMTILISVISEAYSERYKKAVHTVAFAKAVKRYRERTRIGLVTPSREGSTDHLSTVEEYPSSPIDSTEYVASGNRRASRPPRRLTTGNMSEGELDQTSRHHSETARKVIESLPHEILRHAWAFHSHIRYFVNSKGAKHPASNPRRKGKQTASQADGDDVNEFDDDVPKGVKILLDDIAGGAQKLGQRMKDEILQDDEARQTLFVLSLEDGLRNIISAAEKAIDALETRDALLTERERRLERQYGQRKVDAHDHDGTTMIVSHGQ